MVKLTQSLVQFLFQKGLGKEMALIMFGHTELFTPELEKEYLEWVQTPEGLSYLKGGANYKEGKDNAD